MTQFLGVQCACVLHVIRTCALCVLYVRVHRRVFECGACVCGLCACVCAYTSITGSLLHVDSNDGCRAERTFLSVNGGARDGLHACGHRSRVRPGRVVAARHLFTDTLQQPVEKNKMAATTQSSKFWHKIAKRKNIS